MMTRLLIGGSLLFALAAPVSAQSRQSELSSLCMFVEQLAATGSCCTLTPTDLAELTGAQMGQALVAVAAKRPVDPPPPASEQPAPADQHLLIAQLLIETIDADGNKTVVCRPQIMTVEGRPAKIEFGSQNGETMSVRIEMRRIHSIEEASASPTTERPPAADVSPDPAHVEGEISPPREFASPPTRTSGPARAEFEHANPIVIPSELGIDWTLSPQRHQPGTKTWRSAVIPGRTANRRSADEFTRERSGVISAAQDDPYFTRKALYEELYERKIRSLLSHIPDLSVAIEVELDPHVQQSMEQVENATERGVVKNRAELSPLTVKHVSVAIAFPDDYIVQVWDAQRMDEKPPTVEGLNQVMSQVKTSIETLVNNILPLVAPGVNPFPRVAVQSYTAVRPASEHEHPVQPASSAPVFSAGSVELKGETASSVVPWALGVIGLTLLCASIGAAVLFRRSPSPPPQREESPSNNSLIPPRRRAA
jgi:hypothetical protein